MSRAAIFAMQVVTLGACLPPPAVVTPPAPHPAPGGEPSPGAAPPPTISWDRADELGDLTGTPPPPGVWRVHLIDVGTGLAMLVQGSDFTLLYDAGSSDPGEKPERVLAYLAGALGPCGAHLDHVILSHPHQDHASALDAVLHCYPADHVWDAGRVNDAVFYRDFLLAVADSGVGAYHTAAPPPVDRTVRVKDVPVVVPPTVVWSSFSEGDEVALGAGARFTVLHAEAKSHADPNQNSIVVAVELGGARLLLTGDAESGDREDPGAPLGDVEQHLVESFAAQVDADILQVGHHGSSTSSRRAFLAAVSPMLALISAGPRNYKGVILPDPEVVAALGDTGATILRTDEHDGGCPWAPLGPAKGPGGCDSWIITIALE